MTSPTGSGVGFRFSLAEELLAAESTHAQFVEVAPENYLGCGGTRGRWLAMAKERWPIVCHGLCGDFAGASPIDEDLLARLRDFLHQQGAHWYSDHLCLTVAEGTALHDLIPLPYNQESASRAAQRVIEVRKRLELPIAVENVSALTKMPGGTMTEPDFVRAVCEEADCGMLLDVNNVYVNSINLGFNAKEYIDACPLERVVQMHMAGHYNEREDLLIDTHGAPIIDVVYDLYKYTERKLHKLGLDIPVLLERDHNIPPLAELEVEMARIDALRQEARSE